MVKNPSSNAEDMGLILGQEDPLEEKMASEIYSSDLGKKPTPGVLPGKSHEHRSLAGCSP